MELAAAEGTSVTLDASGSFDPDGDPIWVEWKLPSGGRIQAPVHQVLLPLGTHVFGLTVADDRGGFGSAALEITVRDTTGPEVAIETPLPGEIVQDTVTITATASDFSGIDSVTFYVDDARLGQVASPPFSIAWNSRSASSGDHRITAAAMDRVGNGAQTTIVVETPCTDIRYCEVD